MIYPAIRYSNFRMNIFTALKKFEKRISLVKFSLKTGALFEPEIFPSCFYRFKDDERCIAHIFANGNVVIVGPKSPEEVSERFKALETELEGFFLCNL